MIVLNFTGLSRTYWLPKIERRTSNDGLWFLDIRWFQIEVIVYSVEMGTEFIRRLNRENQGES